jgi:hypothetical protein
MDTPRTTIDRRDFLATLVLIPVGAKLAGCGGDDQSSQTCGIEPLPVSTNVGGHTHTLCVLQADLDHPPAGGVTYTTSSAGHTHTVSLTQAQLTTIAGGGSVTVTTSTASDHHHQFTLMLATAADGGVG